VFTTVSLRDGRCLEYADLGDPAGKPVLYFPGTPGTAGGGAVVADAALANGATTTTDPGLTPAAADALELADRLGVDDVVAMGSSGGGPYALALAALAPRRVSRVFVLGGPGVHAEVNPENLDEADRRAIDLLAAGDAAGAASVLMPWAQEFFGPMQAMSDEEFHVAFEKTRPPGENWFHERPDLLPLFEADFQRAITTFDGFVRDNLSWLSTWDVDLAAVTAPVRLVYGQGDQMVPPAHGEWLHQRLPTSELNVVPGGHGRATFGAAMDTFAALGEEPA
jgi:pimeloyl-ACP methyl ester carboxylesterase